MFFIFDSVHMFFDIFGKREAFDKKAGFDGDFNHSFQIKMI